MSSISTSNYWSSSASSSKGMSGLISGLDTDSMVEQLLSGTQSKIDAQKALKQQAQWRQEIYRDMITTINDFRNKYFNFSADASSKLNFASGAFFNNMKSAVAAGSGLNIIGSDSSALSGEMRVKIEKLATTSRVQSDSSISVSSNKVTGSNFTDNLEKLTLTFTKTLNDGKTEDVAVEVNLSGASSMDDIVSRVNSALQAKGVAGVTASKNQEGKMEFKIAKDGDYSFSSAGGSQFAAAMAGLSAGTSIETDTDGNSIVKVNGNFEQNPTIDLSFDVDLDGVTKKITLSGVTIADMKGQGQTDIVAQINDQLKSAFGTDSGGGAKIEVTRTSGGGLEFSLSAAMTQDKGHSFKLTGTDLNTIGILPGSMSTVSSSTKLKDLFNSAQQPSGDFKFTINGKDFTVSADATVGDFMDQINNANIGVKISYSSFADSFTMEATSSGAGFDISYSDGAGGLLTQIFGSNPTKVTGEDAVVYIDGVKTTRSSNTFTVNGITMELTKADPNKEIVIGTTRDVDSIVEGFTEFIKDYNAMLDKLNGYMDEDAEYKDYAPLTDAQKKEMSDREIELWEEKAKTGLVRRDSTVQAFLSEMRSIMYTTPEDSDIALYNIGIETGNYKDKGKLVLNETALREALETDPAAVEKLFTQAKDGLAKQLDDSLKNIANTSSGSPGELVKLAGVKGYSTEKNNSITWDILSIDERIAQLQSIYDKQKERYWSQFNAMEQALANMSAQSGYLQSQFGGY